MVGDLDVPRLSGGRDLTTSDVVFGGVLTVFVWWYLTNLDGALSVDETFYARSGLGLYTGTPYQNPTHAFAPTVKYLVGAGQLAFGSTSFGVRMMIALCAITVLVVVYLLGTELRSKPVGLVAATVVGATYLFAHHATIGVLDVPLTLFSLTGVYAARRWLCIRDRCHLVLLGVAAAAATTAKAYGFVYAVVPVAVVFVTLNRDHGLRAGLPAIAACLGTLFVVYLPYVIVPHPPVGGRLGSGGVMAVVGSLLKIPILGNFVYVFGIGFVVNVLHVSGGHTVTLGRTVYTYAPVWTYLYWIGQYGGVVYAVLFVAAVAAPARRIVRERTPTAHLLCWAVVVPLVFLSLLTVKFPRYILPLFPLVAVSGAAAIARVVDAPLVSVNAFQGARIRASVGLLVLLAIVVTAPMVNPFEQSVTDPLRTDTRYDDAVNFVESYAADHEGETVVVTYHYQTYRYYRGDSNGGDVRTIPLKAYAVGSNDTHFRYLKRLIERGEVNLVVDNKHNPRMRSTTVGQCIRTYGTPATHLRQSPDGDILVVYELPDEPVGEC